MRESSNIWRKPKLVGICASLGLLLVYLFILTIANSFEHAIQQFLDLWYWMTPLVIGFGIQVGLYSYIRTTSKSKTHANQSVAAAGGVSTASMVACCAHHVVDVLPIIGLTAASLFLTKYQTIFLLIGVLSNLVGINLMLNIIQKQHLYKKGGVFTGIFRFDMNKSLKLIFGLSFFIITIALVKVI